MKKQISKRYGGSTEDGRKLVVYSRWRGDAHRRLREAGVVGRIRRLAGRIVNGKPQFPRRVAGKPVDNRFGGHKFAGPK